MCDIKLTYEWYIIPYGKHFFVTKLVNSLRDISQYWRAVNQEFGWPLWSTTHPGDMWFIPEASMLARVPWVRSLNYFIASREPNGSTDFGRLDLIFEWFHSTDWVSCQFECMTMGGTSGRNEIVYETGFALGVRCLFHNKVVCYFFRLLVFQRLKLKMGIRKAYKL